MISEAWPVRETSSPQISCRSNVGTDGRPGFHFFAHFYVIGIGHFAACLSPKNLLENH
jgi:hypothetical protein